jgi:hypothetical protein
VEAPVRLMAARICSFERATHGEADIAGRRALSRVPAPRTTQPGEESGFKSRGLEDTSTPRPTFWSRLTSSNRSRVLSEADEADADFLGAFSHSSTASTEPICGLARTHIEWGYLPE